MKSANTVQTLRVLPLLGLIVLLMHLFLPSPKAANCSDSSCGAVGITVTCTGCQGGSATSRDYCGGTYIAPPCKMSLNGGSAVVSGSGFAGVCPPYIQNVSTKDMIIHDGGTGCRVTPNYEGTNLVSYTFDNAQQPGTITFTLTATGKCNPTNAYACSNATTVTFTANASLEVTDEGCGSGSCPAAGSPTLGTSDAQNNSVDFRINLGMSTPRDTAGFLWLKTNVASAILSQPALLQLPYNRTNVEVILGSSGAIRQINSLEGLVNVDTISSYEYHLEHFYAQNVGAKGGDGLYTTNAPAYVYYVVQNPDGAHANNRLWVTENRGTTSRQFQYTYTATSNEWDLLKPDGQTLSTWQVANPNDSTITNYYRQVLVGSQLLSLDEKTYQYIAGISKILLLQEVMGSGATARTNAYAYYPASSGAASNQLQSVTYADGNWAYYTYDQYGEKQMEYSAYENSPFPGTGGPNTNGDDCKLTEYDYATNANPFGIPYTITVSVPVQNSNTWTWQAVSRTYHLVSDGYDETVRCPDPGGVFNEAGNLHDIIEYWTGGLAGASTYEIGLVMKVQRPDGTSTTYSYPDPYTTIAAGSPEGTHTLTTTTVMDAWGNILCRTNVDQVTGKTIAQEIYVYTNSSGAYFDPLRRTYNMTDLAGRLWSYSFDCCNLASMTDPDGVLTSYSYDVLKRRVASTVLCGGTSGIETTNVLDALGRTLITQRIGTNGNAITLRQSAYDLLGNQILQTNALSGVTTMTNVVVNNQAYITNTYPDGGARIEQYYRDGRLESISGTGVHGVRYDYGGEKDAVTGLWVEYELETKLDSSGNPTSEWTKTYTDGAGRAYKTIYSAANQPYPYSVSYFNSTTAQLVSQVDPDGVTNLYAYDTDGTLEDVAIDLEGSGSIDFGGIDRVTQTVLDVTTDHNANVNRTSTYVWETNSVNASTLASTVETSTDGLTNWQTTFLDDGTAVTTESQTAYTSNGGRTVTITAPDSSTTVNTYSYGRLVSSKHYDSTGAQIGSTTYGYDAHGRQNVVSDARNGATIYGYNNADLVTTVTTPSPGNGGPAQTTTTSCNAMFQVTNVVNPDGTSVTNLYYLTGELRRTSGSRTYPVGYGYDYGGRMQTMTNWQNFANNAGSEVTVLNYDLYRGWLTYKQYPDDNGPLYSYTAAGRLKTRTWARTLNSQPVVTTYGYDTAGGLSSVSYSDSTPGLTNSYNRLGRQTNVVCNGMSDTLNYNLPGQLLSESFAGGVLDGVSVTNGYDRYLRRTALGAQYSSTSLLQQSFGYDAASRLQTVSDGNNNSASYAYVANSSLVGQILFTNGSTLRMTTSKQYDNLNRLTSVISSGGFRPTPLSYNYFYNNANQRTTSLLADGSYWAYQYDNLGQVTSGKKHWNDGTVAAGQQFGYSFDTIGNRTQTQAGGDQNGANLRVANYTNNTLNRITGRDVPGDVDVMGLSYSSDTVTVNGQNAYRKGEYFRQQLSVNNSSSSLWTNITVSASGVGSVSGNVYVAQEPEQFTYDLDGNLTSDGRWNYTWDAENRLVALTNISSVPTGAKMALMFAYDWKGRRVQKTVFGWNNSAYVPQSTNRFAYDGWNLVAELNPQNSPIRTYVWGTDLSGSAQGAGGVGGLLEVSYHGAATTNCFVTFDGNGNVAGLVNVGDGSLSADYEYGPFGEVIRTTGSMARANPLRFSTKHQDDETDLVYYGYRYYNASSGRWLSRDPLTENGGRLLRDPGSFTGATDLERAIEATTEQALYKEESQPYQFNANDGLNFIDQLGLMRRQDLLAKFAQRKAATDGKPCDCNCKPPSVSGSISGASEGGATVGAWYPKSFTDVFFFDRCIQNPEIYWWDCYSASEEGGWSWNWGDYGWSGPGSYYYSKTAVPSSYSTRDPYHIDVASIYIWDECNKGKLTTKWQTANALEFTWDKKAQKWTGPSSYQ